MESSPGAWSAAPARHPRMRRESEPFVTLLSQVEMQPPESDSYCKSLRAVHHLNQPPGWSIKPPGRASPPAGTEGDTCALLDRAGLEQHAWRAPARHTTLTTTEPRWLLRSRRQRVGCIISRLRCRVARLVQFRRFFLKRLGTLRRALVNITQIAPRGFLRTLSFGHNPDGHI